MKQNWEKEYKEKFGKDRELLLSTRIIGKKLGDGAEVVHIVCNDVVKEFIFKTTKEAKQEERERIVKESKKIKKKAEPEENWDGKSGTFGAYNKALEDVSKIVLNK